jgi:ribonuclease R
MMSRYLGEEFQGKITGMVDSGIFVQLQDPYVEGLLPKESMTDDYYEFNEERMVFAGKRRKRTFKIGQEVRVVAVRADIEARQIDFALVEGGV